MANKSIMLKVAQGTSKEGRNYTYCDVIDQDGTQIVRIFVKPTELAYFAQSAGVYEKTQTTVTK